MLSKTTPNCRRASASRAAARLTKPPHSRAIVRTCSHRDPFSFGQLAKTAQRRLFTFELRRGEYAAAARISADVAERGGVRTSRRRCSFCLGRRARTPECAKKKNPAPRSLWWISLILGEGPGGNIA